MNSGDQINQPELTENEEFLMVMKIGDSARETKYTQTEQKVPQQPSDTLLINRDILDSKYLTKTLMIVIDKVWTTFVAFNIVLLPCVVGITLHHTNIWMGDVFGNFMAITSSVLMCWLFTGLPLYIFFLIDMDSMVSELVSGNGVQHTSTSSQTTNDGAEDAEEELQKALF